jgi:hypothetical protein
MPSYNREGFVQKLRALTPSAELMVDSKCRARGIIRDTRAAGVDRFHWSIVPPASPTRRRKGAP